MILKMIDFKFLSPKIKYLASSKWFIQERSIIVFMCSDRANHKLFISLKSSCSDKKKRQKVKQKNQSNNSKLLLLKRLDKEL